jgi:hypothetical protein
LICGLFACGTLAQGDGGDSNLPNRGISSFLPLDLGGGEGDLSPFVLTSDCCELSEPSPVLFGGELWLFVQAETEAGTEIWSARSEDGIVFSEPSPVLLPELAWEGAWIGAPTVVADETGLIMWYQAESVQAVLGLARSVDGVAWEREALPVLGDVLGVNGPSVTYWEGGYRLFYFHYEADRLDRSGIFSSNSLDGQAWTDPLLVLGPQTDCVGETGEGQRCWDGEEISSPGARASYSQTGRALLDLWYTGGLGEDTGIGFAGSFDGQTFVRYEENPVLDGDGPEGEASVIEYQGRLMMYYSDELLGRRAIALANHQP